MTASRRRLLLVGPLPPPLGGVQLVFEMQLWSSLARDFDVHVVDTSKRQLRWAVENPTAKTPFYFVRDLSRLARALVRVRPDAALIHAAPSLSFLRDWVFMVAARLAGTKVVCHYHGTLHARFPSFRTRGGRTIGRLLMKAAHRIIVLGPTYQRRMGEAWQREDVSWAPNMADIALFRDMSPCTPVSWLVPGDRAVLFVGRVVRAKGHLRSVRCRSTRACAPPHGEIRPGGRSRERCDGACHSRRGGASRHRAPARVLGFSRGSKQGRRVPHLADDRGAILDGSVSARHSGGHGRGAAGYRHCGRGHSGFRDGWRGRLPRPGA